MSKFDELMKMAEQFAIYNFNKEGGVQPMWLAETEDGEMMCIATPFESPESKNAAFNALRVMFKVQKVVRFAFMSEAWCVKMPKGEKRPEGSLEFAPNRL